MLGYMADVNIGLVRMPGGSASDKYYWNGNGIVEGEVVDTSKYKAPYWKVDYSGYRPGFWIDAKDWGKASSINMDAKAMHEITRMHPKARNLVTVNAGSGTPEMAAEWVRWANIENNWGIEYWEIGNELNGAWETGHIRPDGSTMDAEKYTEIFIAYAKAMKAVDPTIKIGGPSCDVEHPEYFEPLLRDAGEYVDFITLHYYWLRTSFATEEKLFDGVDALKPFAKELDQLVEKYQPERVGEIEYSVTEWNSKLPKDQDAYRLVNGLWFASWIGEMAKCGIDSATVWDMFSGKDNGHGMLVGRGEGFVPTARYWGFWLWSHYMGDSLIRTEMKEGTDLHAYATRDGETLYVMVMNESRENSYPMTIDLNGFKTASNGAEITLSSREYFWNAERFLADWNSGPSVQKRNMSDGMKVTIPPYCVKVFQFNGDAAATALSNPDAKPELRLLLPESGLGDLTVEGWVRAFQQGTDLPYTGDLGALDFSIEGDAEIEGVQSKLTGAVSRFILKPQGAGLVTVAVECDGLRAEKAIDFKPVVLEEIIAWNFNDGSIDEPYQTLFEYGFGSVDGREGQVLKLEMPGEDVSRPNNRILAIKKYPRAIPRGRIGGVRFDVFVPKGFKPSPEKLKLQVVLQSENAFWIPCGEVTLGDSDGQWASYQLEIPNKTLLRAMDKGFSVLFDLVDGANPDGTLCIDNLGFVLRPE